MKKTTPNAEFTFITINTTTYETCDCLRQIYSPTISQFYDVKCIVDSYSRYIKELRESAKTYLLLFISDSNVGFYRDIYYSFAYRKQNNIDVPITYDNLNDERNYLDFVYYLVKEYIEENKQDSLTELNDSLVKLKNPLYIYNPKHCMKNKIFNDVFRKIIIIPDIDLAYRS